MNLRLEDHVFRILENQSALLGGLGQFNWGLDLEAGFLTFTAAQGGRTLARYPVQLIATESRPERTWLWAWANAESGIPPKLLRGIQQVKETATQSNLPIFLEAAEFPIPHERFAAEISIICAGAMGAFTYYAGGHADGVIYTAIESPPAGFVPAAGAWARQQTIQMGISLLSFDHRAAVQAYLGPPSGEEDDLLAWQMGEEWLRIRFDAEGRVADMEARVTQSSAPPAPPERRPKWRFW